MSWQDIHLIRPSFFNAVLDQHAAVFKDELGYKVIHFCKARSVPYTFCEKVEQELTQLTQEGILEPVQFSDWASPIVPVLKSKLNVRICSNFR